VKVRKEPDLADAETSVSVCQGITSTAGLSPQCIFGGVVAQ